MFARGGEPVNAPLTGRGLAVATLRGIVEAYKLEPIDARHLATTFESAVLAMSGREDDLEKRLAAAERKTASVTGKNLELQRENARLREALCLRKDPCDLVTESTFSSRRVENALRHIIERPGLQYVSTRWIDVTAKLDTKSLLRLRGLGKKSLNEIRHELLIRGLNLAER